MPILILATMPFFRMSHVNELIAKNEAIAKINRSNIPDTESPPARKVSFLENFIEPSVLPVALVSFFMMMFYTPVASFITPFAETIGLSETAASFFIFYTIGLICSRPVVSKLYDKKGGTFVLVPGAIIFIASYVALSTATSQFSLILAAVLLGVGLGACQNTTLSMAVSSAPRRRLGFASATYYVAYDSCASLGPMLAGAIISFAGYRTMFTVAGACTALGLIIYFLLAKRIHTTIKKQRAGG